MYKPILLNDFFVSYSRLGFSRTINKLSEKGFPCIYPDYYALPSHGPHRGHNFIWKQPRGDDSSADQQQLVDTTRNSEESTTTEQPSVKLSTSFILFIHISEFVIKDLYGDSAMPNDSNQREILSRLETYISGGEAIAVDLRKK